MATENDATIRFINPVPKAARKELLDLLVECGFSADDWDGDVIESLKELGKGRATLFARSVCYDHMQAFVAIAKEHNFSLMIHADWHGDYECDFTGQIMAFDAADGRMIDTPAGANDMEPVVTLREALSKTREELIRAHAIPKDLED